MKITEHKADPEGKLPSIITEREATPEEIEELAINGNKEAQIEFLQSGYDNATTVAQLKEVIGKALGFISI